MRTEVTVKVKANMQFKKVFEVAEVCAVFLRVGVRAYQPLFQKRFAKDPGALTPPQSHFSEDKENDLGRV